jgi:chemotaxis signal transduction protein
MLVVVEVQDRLLALCVDAVHDPEELAAADVLFREALGGAAHGPLPQALIAVAKTARGPVPVIDPGALVSPRLLGELVQHLRAEVPA